MMLVAIYTCTCNAFNATYAYISCNANTLWNVSLTQHIHPAYLYCLSDACVCVCCLWTVEGVSCFCGQWNTTEPLTPTIGRRQIPRHSLSVCLCFGLPAVYLVWWYHTQRVAGESFSMHGQCRLFALVYNTICDVSSVSPMGADQRPLTTAPVALTHCTTPACMSA